MRRTINTPRTSGQYGLINNGNDVLPPSTGIGGRNPYSPADGNSLRKRRTAEYMSISAQNTTATVQKAVIFDPSGGYQMMTGFTNDPGVILTGVSAPYQFIINRAARYDYYTDMLQVSLDGASPNAQFKHPLRVYYMATDSDQPEEIAKYNLPVYRHSGQFDNAILDYFKFEEIFEQCTALTTMLEPGATLTFNWKLRGEWGRTI